MDNSRRVPSWYTAAMDVVGLAALQAAIRERYRCESEFLQSAPVHETREGVVVWSGEVDVFLLRRHPRAKHAYAWSQAADDGTRIIHTVLERPPVSDAVTAVRSVLSARLK
jgi:hypothetical protein